VVPTERYDSLPLWRLSLGCISDDSLGRVNLTCPVLGGMAHLWGCSNSGESSRTSMLGSSKIIPTVAVQREAISQHARARSNGCLAAQGVNSGWISRSGYHTWLLFIALMQQQPKRSRLYRACAVPPLGDEEKTPLFPGAYYLPKRRLIPCSQECIMIRRWHRQIHDNQRYGPFSPDLCRRLEYFQIFIMVLQTSGLFLCTSRANLPAEAVNSTVPLIYTKKAGLHTDVTTRHSTTLPPLQSPAVPASRPWSCCDRRRVVFGHLAG